MRTYNERKELLEPLIQAKHNNNKFVVIINGNGESGKDYLIKSLKGLKYKNISSIQPAKQLASGYFMKYGYSSNKTRKNRELLHNLKVTMDQYDEISMKYVIRLFNHFMTLTDTNILFIHIGEEYNIRLCMDLIGKYCNVISLLVIDITCDDVGDDDPRYGINDAQYEYEFRYDHLFYNNKSEYAVERFNKFVSERYELYSTT